MERINDLKDETLKTLAQTLKASGLAASETEAIRMATNMAQTNKKVNTTFEEKKEKNIMGLSFLHKKQKEETPTQKIEQEQVYTEETPTHETKEEPENHQETKEETQCESCNCEHETKEEQTLNQIFEAETKDEFITQDLIKKEPTKEETKQEEPTKEEKPKKDLSQYNESKVNLGEVFKFK